jgi:tetratricopeptide (TPR) repeat protein
MRSLSAAILTLILALAWPASVSAQRASFFQALNEFHPALWGTYGDEGARLATGLDALSSSVAAWDASIGKAAADVSARLPTASAAEAIQLRLALGTLYIERRRLDDALKELEAAIRIDPKRANLQVLRAHVLEAAGRSAEAADAFTRAWTLDPGDPAKAYLRLVRTPGGSSPETDRARATVEDLQRELIRGARAVPTPFTHLAVIQDTGAPVFPPARYGAGFALILEGRHLEGLARLRDALAGDPLAVDPGLRTDAMVRGMAEFRNGRIEAALQHFQSAVTMTPASSEVHRLLGTAYWVRGDLARSAEHLQSAVRLRPDDERSWLALARSFAERGEPEESARVLEEGVRNVPTSPSLHWRLAGLSYRLDKTGDAERHYREAARLTVVSGKGGIYEWLLRLALFHQEMDVALEAARLRVGLDPNNAAARRDLASALALQGRREEALIELTMALWIDPDSADTLTAIGQMHLAAGRHVEAIDALGRAVALQPSLGQARYAFGQALLRPGRVDEGRRQVEEYGRLRDVELARGRRVYAVGQLNRNADLFALDGRYDEAVRALLEVVELDPGSASSHVKLAETLVKAGRAEESIPYFTKAAALDAGADVHRRLAEVLSMLGRAGESARERETYERLRTQELAAGISR